MKWEDVIEELRMSAELPTGISVIAAKTAIKAIGEVREFRKLGTLEELHALKEKQIPKRPHLWGNGCDNQGIIIYDMYDCPECGKSYEIDGEKYDFCPNCGQAFDWKIKI